MCCGHWTRGNCLRGGSPFPRAVLHIGSLGAAIDAIQEGAGFGVVPTHCIQPLLGAKKLREWKSKGGAVAANPIHIVRRLGDRLPKRAELILDVFRSS
jgi:DNA-binding transcriptional LysR family regulator